MKRGAPPLAGRHRVKARPLVALLAGVAVAGVLALLLSGQRRGGSGGAAGRRSSLQEQLHQVRGTATKGGDKADEGRWGVNKLLAAASQGGKPSWCEPEYPGCVDLPLLLLAAVAFSNTPHLCAAACPRTCATSTLCTSPR